MDRNSAILLIILLIIGAWIFISSTRKSKKQHFNPSYYDNPNMSLMPEYPTMDHLAHRNNWTRYNMEDIDYNPFSPY